MYYALDLAQWFLIFAILIGSTGFFVGETGLPFIGHIGFFALGAYSVAVGSIRFQLPFAAGALAGLALNTVAAAMLSLLLLRLTGHLLLITSLGFCEIVRAWAESSSLTNGASGLVLPPPAPAATAASTLLTLGISLGVLSLQLFVHRRWLNSRAGRFLHCLREDTELFQAGGRLPYLYSGCALLFTALTASLAGSLFARFSSYVDPSSFTITQALQNFLTLLIGGLGSQKGNLAAAFIVIIVPGLLRLVDVPVIVAGAINQIFFALLVIVITRSCPRGIFGKYLLP